MLEKLISWALKLAEATVIGVLGAFVVIVCVAAGSWLRGPSEHDAGAFAGTGIEWECGARGYPERIGFTNGTSGVLYDIQGPVLSELRPGESVSVSIGGVQRIGNR